MKRYLLLPLIVGGMAIFSYATADLAAVWSQQCAKCHGSEGAGDTKMGKKLRIKDYTDATVQASFTDEEAYKAIKEGVKDKKGTVRMKPIEGVSDEDIKAMVAYVRSLKK